MSTDPATGSNKLHPLSIPYRIVQSLPGILVLAFFAVFALGQARPGLTAPVGGIVLVLGAGLVVAWQIAYYKRFEYELTSDTFDIRSGVISRRNREIPYRRVQNVDISRTLIQRVLGVAELRLETAGGGESEAHLRYVGYDEAKRLQEDIRSLTRRVELDETGTPRPPTDDVDEEIPLYEISDRDLGVLAAASFDLRVASLLLVVLSFVAPSVVIDIVLAAPIDPLAIILAVIMVVAILSAILSGTSAIVNNWGFILSRVGDELRYERGLLQRFDGSIPIDKVQTLILGENVVMRYFEYATLTVETAGYAPGQGAAESASAVPISKRDNTVSIAREVEDFGELPGFHRPARRARIRYAWQYTLGLGVLTAVAFGVQWWLDIDFSWWAVVFLAPLIPIAAHYKWLHRGYAFTDNYIIMRAGFWRRRTHVVPYYRIQTVDASQTILQRRWKIATVVVDTAGSSGLVGSDPTAYDLDQVHAELLHERLARELQRSFIIRHRRDRVLETDAPRRSMQGPRGTW